MDDIKAVLKICDINTDQNIGNLNLKFGLLENSPMVPNPNFAFNLRTSAKNMNIGSSF